MSTVPLALQHSPNQCLWLLVVERPHQFQLSMLKGSHCYRKAGFHQDLVAEGLCRATRFSLPNGLAVKPV